MHGDEWIAVLQYYKALMHTIDVDIENIQG